MIAAIVLAAGRSDRMGQNKLLLPLGDRTVLDHVLSAIEAAHVHETVVVLGYKPQDLIDAVTSRHDAVRVVINENYEHGMTTSFQKGLQALGRVDAAFLILGDQPALDTHLLDEMIQRLMDHQEALIVSPIHKGKKGHPVLFHCSLFSEIMSLAKTATVRNVVRKHGGRLITIEAPEWTTMDMNTPEDYLRICALMEQTHNI